MKNSKILTQINKIDRFIIVDLVLIILALCWVNYSDIDVVIQKYLFDFSTHQWLVDKDEPIKKWIFYILPKVLFGIVVVGCAIAAILGFRKKNEFLLTNRHRFLLIFIGMALISLIAGNIKKFTNIYCPNQLEIYEGNKPYVKIFESYPAEFHLEKKGKCFPAGHSVVGFSLFILFFTLAQKWQRTIGFVGAVVSGWIAGFYQMAKGAHFFGDTLVAMLVCFLLAGVIARIYLKNFYDR